MKRLIKLLVVLLAAVVAAGMTLALITAAVRPLDVVFNIEAAPGSVTYRLIGEHSLVVGEKRIDVPSGKIWWRVPAGEWTKQRLGVIWWREEME